MTIPAQGLDKDTLFERLETFRSEDSDWRSARNWAYAYDAGRDAEEVGKRAFAMYLSENALDPTVYPSVLKLESALVRIAANHLNAGEEASGNFTSGGTESIMLAVKAARERYRERHPDGGQPEIILPETAHAAFHKSAHYLNMKIVQTPVDPKTFRADVGAMRAAVTDRTALLVGSATSFGPGVVDPIEEIGQIALEHDLLLHVDGCIGAFLLPYFRRLGADIPAFDFTVPGVTSMSMDFHKYGYTPKGASVVVYRSKDLRRYQIYACSRWTGYTVINNTVQSSKSAGPLAAAWAVLNFLGDEGYLELARKLYEASNRLCEGIEAIDGLKLQVRPHMPLIAFTSDTVNMFHLIDEMKERGWYVQPQLSYGGHQVSAHLCVSPAHHALVDQFLVDLAEATRAAEKIPNSGVGSAVRDMFASLKPEQLTPEVFTRLLSMGGVQGTSLPGRMADVNEAINALPPELSERLLIEFFNQLYL